jgi:DNA-binding protein HU-beta
MGARIARNPRDQGEKYGTHDIRSQHAPRGAQQNQNDGVGKEHCKTSARAAASARRSTAKAAKTLAKTVRKAVKAVSNAKAVSRKTAAPAAAKGAVQTRLEDLEKKVSSLRTRYAELKSAVRDLVARLAPHGEGNGTGEAAHAAPARKRTAAARRSRTAQSMTAAEAAEPREASEAGGMG